MQKPKWPPHSYNYNLTQLTHTHKRTCELFCCCMSLKSEIWFAACLNYRYYLCCLFRIGQCSGKIAPKHAMSNVGSPRPATPPSPLLSFEGNCILWCTKTHFIHIYYLNALLLYFLVLLLLLLLLCTITSIIYIMHLISCLCPPRKFTPPAPNHHTDSPQNPKIVQPTSIIVYNVGALRASH